MFCEHCGDDLLSEANFCAGCGTKVSRGGSANLSIDQIGLNTIAAGEQVSHATRENGQHVCNKCGAWVHPEKTACPECGTACDPAAQSRKFEGLPAATSADYELSARDRSILIGCGLATASFLVFCIVVGNAGGMSKVFGKHAERSRLPLRTQRNL